MKLLFAVTVLLLVAAWPGRAEHIEELRKRAGVGEADAQCRLGVLALMEQGGVPTTNTAPFHWFKSAADQEHPRALACLGLCYSWGIGVSTNDVEANRLFELAAGRGDPLACLRLARAAALGCGMASNAATAAQWYRRGATTNLNLSNDLLARFALGQCLRSGFGVPVDRQRAYYLLQQPAAQGVVAAQKMVGEMLNEGLGVTREPAEAMKWYRKVAERGDVEAQVILGNACCSGQGVSKNFAEAVTWYRKAAEQGSAEGQNMLGAMYYEGFGISKDAAEAVKWWRKSAEQGHVAAILNLARAYQYGMGVLQDDVEAMKFYLLSTVKGMGDQVNLMDRDVAESVQKYRRAITPDAYREAQRRVREWQERHDVTGGRGGLSGQSPEPGEVVASGTAFCISTNGYFLTCAHVVAEGKVLSILLGGQEKTADLVKRDKVNDLAILKIEGAGYTPLPIDFEEPAPGARVRTIGFPHPDIQGESPKYTEGVISALSGIEDDPRTYQISIPVQRGNSGGPLVDEKGNGIGVVVMKMIFFPDGGCAVEPAQNVNYAVKAAYAWPLIRAVPGLKAQLPAMHTTGGTGVKEIEPSIGLVRVRARP